MNQANGQKNEGGSSRRAALVGVYLLAATLGYVLGARGAFADRGQYSSTTPLARIGFVLREQRLAANSDAWAILPRDVDSVRPQLKPADRDVFELVVALRGLATGGKADFEKAGQICRTLKWPRCDQVALEELQRRCRP